MTNKTWAVTGGTGSFGRAWIRYCIENLQPKAIRSISRDEFKLSRARAEEPGVDWLLGDVRSKDRLYRAFKDVEVVVHAAALKRIECGERDSREFCDTNITGTANVVDGCLDRGTKRAVFISTDKAVHPHNLYGATKCVAEKLWVNANSYSGNDGTDFVGVRYGNVTGSRGSVLYTFREQASAGGPITITDSNMTRFWMTLESACRLVHVALDWGERGEVFIPRLESYKVTDLAEAVAPGVPQKVIGARPSEKLHEVLVSSDEAPRTSERPSCYVVEPECPSWSFTPGLGRGIEGELRSDQSLMSVETLRERIRCLSESSLKSAPTTMGLSSAPRI